MAIDDGRWKGTMGVLWQFAALAGLAAAVSLLQQEVWLAWLCFSSPRPHEFGSLPWGLNLIGVGLPLLLLCWPWLFQGRER